jgi:2-dehydropantoate 2-reductase
MGLDKPVIAVVGTGAVGGYYGAKLAQRGFEVHFLLRSDYEAVRTRGLVVKSCEGDFVIGPGAVRAYDDTRKMPKADLVIVGVKAREDVKYEELVGPLVKEETAVLTLQNGLGNEERLAEAFGAGRVMGGLAFVCIDRPEAGVIRHMDYGYVRVGELVGKPSARTARVAEMFSSSGVKCDVLEDLRYGRWEKLVWNIPFSGLGTALDLTTDQILASEAGEKLAREIMQEVVATANAIGVKLPAEVIERMIRQTRVMKPYRSSMHLDRQLGRPMEVEAIFGRPLRVAREAGVGVPRLEMLYEVLSVVDGANQATKRRSDGATKG